MSWKLISWNCCLPPWSVTRKHRLPLIVSTILNENPDLICLQEVFSNTDAQYLAKKLYKEGFGHSFKFQDLLIVSKGPLLSSFGRKFKEQGGKLSFSVLDALYGKAFQLVTIQAGDAKLVVANTHLLSAYALSGKKYQETRTSQMGEIFSHLKTTANNQVVVVGDFNFVPTAEPYEMINKSGFDDLSRKVIKTKKAKKLDYIIAKNLPSETLTADSKFTDYSDHAYLTLELTILKSDPKPRHKAYAYSSTLNFDIIDE